MPEPAALQAGARVGRYLILDRVGSGAMGVVYGAYDPELDRKIALKLLRGDEPGQAGTARARLLREARATARLAHPNVVVVHDVGLLDGQVFLAMEFLGGGTLRSWLAAGRRGWREVLEVFIAAGRGLLAAHSAGLVHRDFKPENVLLDKDGRPRVVDFGLARDAHDDGDGAAAGARDGAPDGAADGVVTAPGRLDTVTRAGTIVGTPAYMAPEQFLDEPTDPRTDQFSFCVALYEALYGLRPFGGESVLQLLHNMETGEPRPPPADREVPAWIRRAVVRGLASDPAQRWESMALLIAALEDDPAVRRRRWLMAGAGLTLVVAAAGVGLGLWRRHRQDVERQIGARLHDAGVAADIGRARDAEVRTLRQRAFDAFDAMDRAGGEELWRRTLALAATTGSAYERAERAYEAALVLEPARAEVRDALGDLITQHLRFARDLGRDDEARALAARLEPNDPDDRRRAALRAPGTLILYATPATASITLERFERDAATGRLIARPLGERPAPGLPIHLAPGSYRATARAPGHVEVADPFELEAGQRLERPLRLPLPAEVPAGFAYVPAGELWFGDADENLRVSFLDTVPIHRRRIGAFLIARHETTYREWIDFLASLPRAERARYAPDVSAPLRGSLRLLPADRRAAHDDGWQLTFQPTSRRYTAREGEPFIYAGRKRRARQDWRDFPVAGTAPADAERYLRWLRETGRVPGARLCSELEWERAARGADQRVYPHGDELGPDDANFDVTYGRVDSAFGPDAVGAHATSRSPFGVDDLAGNVLELVRSSLSQDELVVRGGAYFFNSATCRLTNRNAVPSTFRDVTSGIRVCAPAPEGP